MKTLIVSGGKIDRDFSCSYIKEREFDLIIAADGGPVSYTHLDVYKRQI